MKIIKDLNIEVHKGVYEPSDDTYLLLDLIKLEGDEEVLEIGSGTGIITLHCRAQGCEVLSVDKDKRALENTRTNAKKNDMDISLKKSTLFSNINKDDWDIIIFNPPYLPEENHLKKDDRWDGGTKGDEIIVEFLKKADRYLSRGGELFFCYSSLSPDDKIKDIIEKKYELIETKKSEFFYETLYGVSLKNK